MTKKNLDVWEKHYYRETTRRFTKISDPLKQDEIDTYMQHHHNSPPHGITREMGYSSIVINKTQPAKTEINPSLLKKSNDSSALIISRLRDAPELPVSCLAAAEHVISMQNAVADFISEYQPPSKNKVMYQILVKQCGLMDNYKKNKERFLHTFLNLDSELKPSDISICFINKTKLYTIEISTQKADIQKIIKAIRSLKGFRIIDPDFTKIGLNEGLCLINDDVSNDIHAIVNIANTASKKVFLERDAGRTSGLKTANYKDNHWTFNFYKNIEDIQQRAGFNQTCSTARLFLKN